MQTVQHWLDNHHFLHRLVEFGGVPWMRLNHQWHGINMLSVLECALLAMLLCTVLAGFGAFIRRSRRLTAIALAGTLSFATAAYAANTQLSLLTSSGALAGANLLYVVQSAGSGGVKATFTQVATFLFGLVSGDATATGGGALTVTKTNGVAFTALATTAPGTGVATAATAALSAAGGLTSTIASGTAGLGTGAIGSGACAAAVTVAGTNIATTDTLLASFNGDPTAVTGYIPATAGMLTIIGYPTSGNANFRVCNNTNASVTPGAITLNWRVVR